MRLYELLSPQATSFLLDKYSNVLTKKLTTDIRYKKLDLHHFVAFVTSCDPTQNSKYTPWLIKLYATNGIKLLEDIHKLTNPLMTYTKLIQSKKLPLEYRDINKFNNLNDFLDMIETNTVQTSNEIKNNEETNLIQQAVIYYNSPEIKIVIPKTQEAAMYYGRNTRWCTSAKSDNMFDDYNKNGSLYIILFKKQNMRWQFHFETGSFMDEKDEELSPEQVKTVYHLFPEDVWLAAVKENGSAIRFIKNPSKAVKLAAVKQDGFAIRYIEIPSEILKLAAVNQNGYAIDFIKDLSEVVQLAAVNQNGYAIKYIKNPSEILKLAAVKQKGNAIFYIENPSEMIQLAAVKQNISAIKYIENPSEAIVSRKI